MPGAVFRPASRNSAATHSPPRSPRRASRCRARASPGRRAHFGWRARSARGPWTGGWPCAMRPVTAATRRRTSRQDDALHRNLRQISPDCYGNVRDDAQPIASITAARSSGMPSPFRSTSTRMSGCAAGRLRASSAVARGDLGEFGRLDLVGLGQDQAIADRRLVEHVHDLAIDILDAVPRIDQHQRPLEHVAPAQEVVDQEAPLPDDVLGRLGEAVAGHVDQPERERLADVEEVELLRPPRRVRRARQAVAVGQRVEQRRLADVRPARERHFGHVGVGQMLELRRGFEERDRPGEGLARGLDRVLVELAHLFDHRLP